MVSYYLEQILSSFMVQLPIETFSKKEIKNLTKNHCKFTKKSMLWWMATHP